MSVTLAFRPLDTAYPWPTSDQAAFAAKLSADRGEYRIAQQLMGLACALKDREDTEAFASLKTALGVNDEIEVEQPRTPLRVAPYLAGPTGNGDADLAAARGEQPPTERLLLPTEVIYTCPVCVASVRGGENYANHKRREHGLDDAG